MNVELRMKKLGVWGVLFFTLIVSGCKKKTDFTVANENVSHRIVALSPASAEILFAVGAGNQVVAVSEFTDFPEEATKLPVVGGFDGKTLSMESILSFKPDLVYLTDGMHNFMISQLEEYGIKYYVSVADSINSVEKEILEIGELTGHVDTARSIVDEMNVRLISVSSEGISQTAYYEVWNSPYISCGGKSFISDVLNAAGYKNIFEELKDSYPIVSEESIISREPDVIFIAKSTGISIEDICSRAGWETIPAVINKKIFIVDDNVTTRPGPRVVEVVEELRKLN